ncbi:uncharacterized protein si:dkey-256h2.1 [Synchiropus splendidus]|uniref:uncharacterized protein si:dkey-256h2.1 n=1 Tax=Synchiropus splendidus TaxID=270530 RepID=UPI00237E73FA|nr:uncharacterized protein si:dkey-256h2.1 [Synchiropus splendidus]
MAVLLLQQLWWLLVVTAHVTGGRSPRRLKLILNEEGDAVSPARLTPAPGLEPGDSAAAFRVPTLGGELVFKPGPQTGSLVLHAFTNHSGFLEVLWSSESSVSSLLQDLPDTCQVLFLSLDESSVTDALWMREQLQRAAASSGRKEVLSRLHFCPVPLFALGSWVTSVFYAWSCRGHNCGLSQAAFTADGWRIPLVVKRLDARYDWLTARWGQGSYPLRDGGDGCASLPSVAGGVAWVSEGGCSFFTKVQTMARSNASGVLVYALPGSPLQDMNCVADECDTPLNVPAAMVHQEPAVAEALRWQQQVSVSFQTTDSPNFFFGINQQGALWELGWFLYPSFSFIAWQAQWFEFYSDLRARLDAPAVVVPVFDRVRMQGDAGAVASVRLPPDLQGFDGLELDASLSCPGRRDSSCAQWDHTVQLLVCCDRLGPHCGTELGRWITAFRRGSGHWTTDVSPLLPVLDGATCTFTMKTVPWAMPWIVSLNLRFKNRSSGSLRPFRVMPLFSGGTFDRSYNSKHRPVQCAVPPSTQKVELFAVITGHGSDENGCGEFCVTSHHFVVNAAHNNTLTFDTAGSALGCTSRVKDGAVPNEHGTWLYGRGGWCDGLQVAPWRRDVTDQLDLSGTGTNTILYFGLFNGLDPNPSQTPGYIIMSSFLVFYK